MQLGALAVVLAASIRTTFELDRFLAPKELVLHLTALIAGLLVLRSVRATSVDLLLATYLLLSAVSVVFATNRWLGLRALTVSASAIAIFWIARALADAGLARPLLGALAFAVVLAAGTALLQAYGIRLDIFSLNRAPGGTLGNRNFVAHAAAFGLPICILAALRGRRIAALGVGIVVAALVLTRSRAGWIAAAAALAILFGAILLAGPLRRSGPIWARLFGILIVSGGAVAAALLIPNTLRWRSDNPYLESVTGVVNYGEGSGRGRLVQYEHSLLMAARHPLFGVGPGNWPVVYPAHAARNDPSMSTSEGGMTWNPWPSSDWIAFVSERGIAAAVLMALVFGMIAIGAVRRLFAAPEVEEALLAATLLATAAAAVLTGLFDAVLLLALPALIVWAALGALECGGHAAALSPAAMPPGSAAAAARPPHSILILPVLLLTAIGLATAAGHLVAMEVYATGGDLEWASKIDPGNYRIHLRLGRKCAHAKAARALYPNADRARALARRCK